MWLKQALTQGTCDKKVQYTCFTCLLFLKKYFSCNFFNWSSAIVLQAFQRRALNVVQEAWRSVSEDFIEFRLPYKL